MAKRFTNFIIKILLIILLALVVYILVLSIMNKKASTQAYIRMPQPVIINQDWSEKVEELKTKLHQDASINVLEGTLSIEKTYKNEDTEGKGNSIGFLKKKFIEWQSRSLHINTEYKFGYAINVKDIQVYDLGNGEVSIDLYQNDLYIKYIEEQGNKRQLSDDYGFLATPFTVQETNAVLYATEISVQNTLNNSSEIRDKAIEYARSTIKGIAESFGFKNVEVEVIPDSLIDNEEVEIKSINN